MTTPVTETEYKRCEQCNEVFGYQDYAYENLSLAENENEDPDKDGRGASICLKCVHNLIKFFQDDGQPDEAEIYLARLRKLESLEKK